MIQTLRVVRFEVTFGESHFARIDSVSDARSLRFHRTPTQRTVVHFAGFVVPQIGMQAMRMLDLFAQLLHRAVLLFDVELVAGRIGRGAFLRWTKTVNITFLKYSRVTYICVDTLCAFAFWAEQYTDQDLLEHLLRVSTDPTRIDCTA